MIIDTAQLVKRKISITPTEDQLREGVNKYIIKKIIFFNKKNSFI